MSTDTPNTQRFGSLPRIQTLVPGDIVVPATTMAGGAVEGGASVPPNTDVNFTLQMVLEQIPEQYHGKSAYQVAVDNGFVGDEAAWLLSLVGPRGLSAYEVALVEGFEGTPSQWLASLVGAKGDDGRTAYEVAVDEGFSGTAAEWLESIIGATGDSAYEVAVKNGFVGTESEWLASLKGDPGTTEWDGLSNKPAVIASGATKSEARASLDLGTAALSSVADFATAEQGLKADGAVQLESPGIAGRVAVFGSLDGVVPGVALGTAATASFENMPFVNRLVDSGRFDGGGNQYTVVETDFDAASQFAVENGATIALGGRFFNDNDDFGGSAGPLETTIADLITATGRTGTQGRNGVEFMIASITAGAGSSRGVAFTSGTKYPMVSASDHQMVAGQGGRATWVGWLRAYNGNVGLGGSGCTVYVMGAAAGAQAELASADGWRHVRIVSDQTTNGELRDFPYFYGASGARLEVGMSAVFAGVADPGIHSTPLLGDGDGGEFPWTLEEIGAAPIHNPHFTGVVEGVTKEMVGLGNADNTADVNKIVAGVAFKDTRAVNDPPSTLAASQAAFAVKTVANADNPPVSAGGGLAYIGNFAGMAPTGSEGMAVQLSFGDGLAIRQATGISVWGPWRKLWHDGNMGAGSGLIADMLDGFHESAFLRSAFASDWSAKPAIMTPVSGSTNGVNGSTTYYGVILPSGSTPNTHNVAIAGRGGEIYFRALEAGVYGNWNKLLHSGNTGPGAGLDADKLGSQLPAYYLNRANHTGTQAWGTITGTPTSLAGYGITDAVSKGGTDTITGFKYFTTRIAGGFGGNARAEGSNWNNSVLGPTTELIHRPSTSTNGPTVADPTKYFHTLVFETGIVKNQSGDLTQLIVPDGENASIAEGLWLRGRYSGTWGSWRRIPIESADGKLSARVLKATAVQGSMPLEVTSTTLVTNLNADMLDGFHANAFALANNSVLTGTTSLQNATVDGLLTASRLSRGNGFASNTGSANVGTSTPVALVDNAGLELSPQKTYRVSGYISGSGLVRGAVVLFVGDGSAFTREVVYEEGNTSNHVEFFLNAGVPSVRLYNQETLYTVKYLVEEVANFGRAFSDFGIINKASRDGTNASGTWGISITGSAATLTTPRSINGTNFDGSANITTATWGTARNLTIGASTKSVNGSASVDWTLSEIGAEAVAAKGVPNGYAPLGADGKIALTYLPASMPGSDSADRLSTPRTFTIGLTGKTFDGTANVSWSLTEIGAVSTSGAGATGTWDISISGNAATVTNGLYSTGSYADPAWLTSLNYSKLVGTVPTWNQNTTGSAAKLTTPRSIALSGAATGTATNFDGSSNITIPVTGLNAANLNAGVVPDARLSGTYTGISVKVPAAGSIYSIPSSGTEHSAGRASTHLAQFRSTAGAATGAIVFYAPTNADSIMHQFVIQGMLYNPAKTILTTAQIYRDTAANGNWQYSAKVNYGSIDPMVRFAITADGRTCLILGDIDTVWSYPHVALSGIFSHTGLTDAYMTGWTTGLVTDLSTFTALTAEVASDGIASTRFNSSTPYLFLNGTNGAQDVKVRSLVASNSYSDVAPTNGIYSKGVIQSAVATGTAPFTVASTTAVANLNADLLDGKHASDFLSATGNASSATVLQTARTLTIGSTGKSFDGSANVSWSRTEIGVPLMTSTVNVTAENTEAVIGYIQNPLFGVSDGALYSHVYSSAYKHQIQGDYRTGQIAVRGKNNGTWQAWRVVLDDGNFNNYAPTKTGVGASGTWSIDVGGNAATATALQTARTIALSGAATGTATAFDGSGNIAIPVTGLNASNLNTGTVPDARLAGTYTGISIKVPQAGSIYSSNDTSANRVITHVASYRSSSSAATGAIVFSGPAVSTIMCLFRVKGMLYVNEIIDFSLKGYFTTTWAQAKLQHFGTTKPMVRLGKDAAGNPCIIIGDVGSVWSYPHIAIEFAMLSHTGATDTAATGWSSALVTDLSAFTAVSTAITDNGLNLESPTLTTPIISGAMNISGGTINSTAPVQFLNSSAAQGIKVGSLVVSSSYGANAPTNGIYSLGQIQSGVAVGTAPFIVASTTVNANLNADLLDGQHGSYYASQAALDGKDKLPTEVAVATARATVAKVGTTTGGSYVPAYGDRINVTFSDGISATSPTLNIDGGGAKNIRLGLTNVSTTLLSTGAGTPVTIPLWYDGTYWQMYGSHLNTTYSSVSLGGLQTGTASTGYLASPLVLTQWKDWFLTDYAKTADVNAMLAVRPILNRGQGFISWTGEVSVTPASGVVLLDSAGVPLSPTKTYKVSACNIDSTAQRGAVALFVGDGTNFTIKTVYEQGTTSSNVQLYLDAGVPSVSVYGGTGPYRIPYIIEEAPNFGQPFSEFALLQRPIDAPSDGKTYGRKDAAWIEIASGGGATNISLGTVTSTAVPLVSSTGTGVSLTGATSSLAGLLVAADKSKLDGIATGATAGATWGSNISSVPAALTSFGSLANGSGWLRNNGTGTLSYSTPTKTDVGLGNVDNTADSAKSVLSATKLTTARLIGGVSFDGTTNINLPGVNTAGNQNTTGSAAALTTARTLTIGNTGKTFNGTANVSWTLAEIGAVANGGSAIFSTASGYSIQSGSDFVGPSGYAVLRTGNPTGTIYIRPNGDSVSGQSTLSSSGIWTAADFSSTSDERLKENWRKFDASARLEPWLYSRISTGVDEYGFSAQVVERSYPELVSTDSEGYKSISYNKITAILAKQLNDTRDELCLTQERLLSAEDRIHSLEERLASLEARFES